MSKSERVQLFVRQALAESQGDAGKAIRVLYYLRGTAQAEGWVPRGLVQGAYNALQGRVRGPLQG